MFSGCLQDFSRMFSGCSDGSCGPGGIWWSFQMKVWTLMIQRNLMIPNYSMIPAIRWSPVIRWSIGSMDFDNPKVYGDTFIADGLVFFPLWIFIWRCKWAFCMKQFWHISHLNGLCFSGWTVEICFSKLNLSSSTASQKVHLGSGLFLSWTPMEGYL